MDILSEMNRMIKEIKAGNYDTRLNYDSVSSEEADLVKKINNLAEIYSEEIKKVKHDMQIKSMECTKECVLKYTKIINDFAKGNFQSQFHISDSYCLLHDLKPQFDSVSYSINKFRTIFQILEKDLNTLLTGIKEDNYNKTIDLSQYPGEFQKVAKISQDIVFSCKDEIKQTFGDLNKKIAELSSNINSTQDNVLEVAHSSDQVGKNSRAVSDNTEQSDAGVRQVLRAMEDLSVTVGDVSQKAESVSRLSLDGTQMSREGSEYAKKAENGMIQIISRTEEADHLISEMQGDMKKINDIVKFITDIANQTNLLALNAAIEAARAGEAGRGFAVVATEVKTLALESRKSAEKITDMISSLQKQSQKAVGAVSLATEAVREGNILLSDTLGIFGRLAESVEEISINIEQVASMNEEQAAAVEEITSSMHEVSAMLKDTAKEAEESAKTTNDTSETVNKLNLKINHLSDLCGDISGTITRFI